MGPSRKGPSPEPDPARAGGVDKTAAPKEPPRAGLRAGTVLALQGQAGNAAVSRILSSSAQPVTPVQRRLGPSLPAATPVVHHLDSEDEDGFKVLRYSDRIKKYTLESDKGNTVPNITADDPAWGTKVNQKGSRTEYELSKSAPTANTGQFDYASIAASNTTDRTQFQYWFYYMLQQISELGTKKIYLEKAFEPNSNRTLKATLDTDKKKRDLLLEMFGLGFVSYENLAQEQKQALTQSGAKLANAIPGETRFGYGFRGDNRKPDELKTAGGFTTKADSNATAWRGTQGLNADWNPFKYQNELPGQNSTNKAGYFRRDDKDNDLTTIISVTPNFVDATKFPFIEEYKEGSRVDKGVRISETNVYLVLVEEGFDTKAAQGSNAFPEIATRTVPWANVVARYRIERHHNGGENPSANHGHKAFLQGVDILPGAESKWGGTPSWPVIMQAVETYSHLSSLEYLPASRPDHAPAVKLSVSFHTKPGQDLYVAGSTLTLGNWDPAKAVPMRWKDDNTWDLDLAVKGLKLYDRFEYKYIVKEGSHIRWEGGANHIYDASVRVGESTPDRWHA
jgi:Starch binding domain